MGSFHKNKQQKSSNEEKRAHNDSSSVSFYHLFRFADPLDTILILLGVVLSVCAGGSFPLMYLFFDQIASVMHDYLELKEVNFNMTQLLSSQRNRTLGAQHCPIRSIPVYDDFYQSLFESVKPVIILGVFTFSCHILLHLCWNFTAERQIQKLKNTLYKSILRQDMAFFDKSSAGEFNSVLHENVEKIKMGINYKLGDCINQTSRVLSALIMNMIMSWKFTIVFLVLIPIIIMSTRKLMALIKKHTIEEMNCYGRAGRVAQEMLSAIRTVAALGLEAKAVEKYDEIMDEAERIIKKKSLYSGVFGSIATGMNNIFCALGIFYGTYLIVTDCQNNLPYNIVSAIFCFVIITVAMGSAIPFFTNYAESTGAARKVFEIIDTKSNIDILDTSGKILKFMSGDVEFKDVEFSYPQRPDTKILKGLNMKISGGQTVALVGSSGGGKSTVVSLLERFYLPTNGKILVDGNSIEDLDLQWFRSQMALVSQEPVLFSTSIRENIRLGRLDATDVEIEEAAKCANAHEFIKGTTKGYETQVGERGTQLSGGQKQRIAIARALIRNPRILLLDEATSALDYESEKVVQEALDKANVGRTTIIIAHRLSTIKNADVIMYLKDGQVVESGNHDELMSNKGFYFELVMSQTTNKEVQEEERFYTVPLYPNIGVHQSSSSSIYSNSLSQKTLTINETNGMRLRKKHERKSFFRYEKKIAPYHKPEKFWLLAASVSQIVTSVMFPCIGLVFCEIFNLIDMEEADGAYKINESLKFMGILLAMALVNMIANLILSYGFSLGGVRLTKRLGSRMLESLLRQEMAFHDLDANRSSILATQLGQNSRSCRGLTSDKMSVILQGFAGIVASLVIGFSISWKLTLVQCIFAPISFVCGLFYGKVGLKVNHKGKVTSEETGRLLIETVENVKTVALLGREEYFIREFEKINQWKRSSMLIQSSLQAVLYAVPYSLISYAALMTTFLFGFYLMTIGKITLSNLFRVQMAMGFTIMFLGRVSVLIPDQKKSKAAAKSVFRIIDRTSKIDSLCEQGLKPNSLFGHVRFENVYFNYPTRPDIKIMQGFSLECKPNETNALVGPSGCGKSTTIALLLRFYDVDAGAIYLDGIDIRDLNIRWLRSKIGLVSQEPILFNTSILENINYGDVDRTIDLREVIECAVQSNIQNKIETLPERYETIVGSKGGQLSGGEKQRVAIARALVRQPRILLLDEATSALDNASEQIVQEALDRAQSGRTCLVIAHRLTTIQNANSITVVKSGRVCEEGTHSQLMDDKSFYFDLYSKHV